MHGATIKIKCEEFDSNGIM